jgi:hypothetical protein
VAWNEERGKEIGAAQDFFRKGKIAKKTEKVNHNNTDIHPCERKEIGVFVCFVLLFFGCVTDRYSLEAE